MAKQSTAAPKTGPKFGIGDKVWTGGKMGTITEVPDLAAAYLATNPQFYSVLLDSDYEWDESKKQFKSALNGDYRDHKTDSLGCVSETDLEPV